MSRKAWLRVGFSNHPLWIRPNVCIPNWPLVGVCPWTCRTENAGAIHKPERGPCIALSTREFIPASEIREKYCPEPSLPNNNGIFFQFLKFLYFDLSPLTEISILAPIPCQKAPPTVNIGETAIHLTAPLADWLAKRVGFLAKTSNLSNAFLPFKNEVAIAPMPAPAIAFVKPTAR